MRYKIYSISIFLILALLIKINAILAAENFYLSAQSIYKNEKNNTITAFGKVNITSGNYKLKADKITYFLQKNKLYAKGNVIIFEKGGSVFYASEAELSDTLKINIIKNIGVLLSDNSRLAASSAKSFKDNNKTIYKNIIFTKCNSCEDNNSGDVLWKLKAKKATHLKKSKIILYESVYLEAFNIPILYVPIFYHPDPSVKSKTGLLTPKISKSNTFGVTYEQPIFFNLSKKSNLTVDTKYSSKEGFFLANDHNKISNNSNFKLKYSITEGTKIRVNEPSKKEIRGHFDLKYIYKTNNNWQYGANIKRSSDKSYLSKYNLSEGESVLNQNLFTEWGDIYKNITFDLFKFQSLSDEYEILNLPYIRPNITVSFNNLNNKRRKRNYISEFSLNSITRKNNKNVNSLHLVSRSNKSYIYDGILFKDFNIINVDAYNSDGTSNQKKLIKVLPQLGLEIQYPLISKNNTSSFLIEPKVQLFLSPDDYDNNKIRNEDSTELDLASSNLFNYDRYVGFDRIESGIRGNYGFIIKNISSKGQNFSGSLGQTYNANKQELFNKNSGFKNNRSEIVGNIIYSHNAYYFNYDFRISEKLNLNRNTVTSRKSFKKLDFELSYIQLKSFASARHNDTEQINYKFKYNINKPWSIYLYQLRDLAGALYSSPLRTNIGINFSNECTTLELNYARDRSYNVDIPAETNISFNIKLFGF